MLDTLPSDARAGTNRTYLLMIVIITLSNNARTKSLVRYPGYMTHTASAKRRIPFGYSYPYETPVVPDPDNWRMIIAWNGSDYHWYLEQK